MKLKYAGDCAGAVNFNGRKAEVWKYASWDEYYAEEEENDGLPPSMMAWVEEKYLVHIGMVVGTTTREGHITWLKAPESCPGREARSRGKRRETPIIEEVAPAADYYDIGKLWDGILNFDWEAIMIRTTS